MSPAALFCSDLRHQRRTRSQDDFPDSRLLAGVWSGSCADGQSCKTLGQWTCRKCDGSTAQYHNWHLTRPITRMHRYISFCGRTPILGLLRLRYLINRRRLLSLGASRCLYSSNVKFWSNIIYIKTVLYFPTTFPTQY